MGQPTRRLIVARGLNVGAGLIINHDVKMVGRARDANLVLVDRAVSRHHFHVVATEQGARVHVCEGAAPLLHAGREIREAIVKVGDSVVVGETVLVVTEAAEVDDVAQSPIYGGMVTTNVRALLVGAAADVRGLAAVFALDEALSAAHDMRSIETTVSKWAGTHAECQSVELVAASEEQVASREGMIVVETVASGGLAKVGVPVHGAESAGWLAFSTTLPPKRVTDALRRLFIVAGRICGSRLSQLSALNAVKSERESFRRQAFGSARAFLGVSTAAREIVDAISTLATSNDAVLLTGERGVGKTFVARLIHESGPRGEQRLRVVNCASTPVARLEAEIFGREGDPFTSTLSVDQGAFEAAGQGTVLLDEVAELPLDMQEKLARALTEKRFERVGSSRSWTLEARVLAATHRDLDAMVAKGTFRSDLLAQLTATRLVVPPLRARGGDLSLLAEHMLIDLAPMAGRRVEGFTPEALERLRGHRWPGNVRELRNVIEHALLLGDGPRVESAELFLPPDRARITGA